MSELSAPPTPIPSSESVSRDLIEQWIAAAVFANSRRANFRRLECFYYGPWKAFLTYFLIQFDPFFALIPQLTIADLGRGNSMAESTITIPARKGTVIKSRSPDFVIVVFDIWMHKRQLHSLDISPEDWPQVHLKSHFVSIIVELKRGPRRNAISSTRFTDSVSSSMEEAAGDCIKQARLTLKSNPKLKRVIGIIGAGEWFCWTIFLRKVFDVKQVQKSSIVEGPESSNAEESSELTTEESSAFQVRSGPGTRAAKAKAMLALEMAREIRMASSALDRKHDAKANAIKWAKDNAEGNAAGGSDDKDTKAAGEDSSLTEGGQIRPAVHRWDLDPGIIVVQELTGKVDIKSADLPLWKPGGAGWSGCARLFSAEAEEQFQLVEQLLRNDIINRDGQLLLKKIREGGPDTRRDVDEELETDDSISEYTEEDSDDESEYGDDGFVNVAAESEDDKDGDPDWDSAFQQLGFDSDSDSEGES